MSDLNIALVIIGFVSIVSQTLLVREFVGVFCGNELCLGVIFAGWLFWMAAGSLGAGRIFKTGSLQALVFSQVIVAVCLPLTIILIKTIRVLLHVPVGELMGYHIMFVFIPLVLAPLGIVIGSQFTLGCRLYAVGSRQSAVSSLQPPAFSLQPPAFSLQPSAFSLQPSAFSLQPSAFSLQPIDLPAAKVYLYDAIGDILGGFAFGYIFVNLFNSLETAFYTSIISLLCGIMLLVHDSRKCWRNHPGLLPAICISCLLVNLSGSLAADKLTGYINSLNWKGFEVVKTAVSRYGDLIVVKTAGNPAEGARSDNPYSLYHDGTQTQTRMSVPQSDNLYSLYREGMLVFTSPQQLESEELIHFPLLETPGVERILILGGAVAGGLKEALKYKGAEVYYVELDPIFIETAKGCITGSDLNSLADPRVKIVHSDSRLFVKQWHGKPFDALIVNTGDPSTAERNRLYTLEFFKEAKRILKAHGVISLSVRSNEDYLGENMLQFNGCIYHTLRQVFPSIVLIPGDRLIMIGTAGAVGSRQSAGDSRGRPPCLPSLWQLAVGSKQSESGNKMWHAEPASCLLPTYMSIDPHTLSDRLKQRGIETGFVNEHYLSYRFYPERIAYLRESLSQVLPRINHDLHPVCYYFDLLLWGEEFSPGIEKALNLLLDLKPWQLILTVVLVMMPLFRKRMAFIPTGVFISGCGGMVLEIVLIIGFQILFGYVYHLIGIVIAGFMAGIAIGTYWMNSRIDRVGDRVKVYSLLQIAMAGYLFATPIIFLGLKMVSNESLVQILSWILFPVLTALAGVLVGLIFPLANRIYSAASTTRDPARVGGLMYSLDLAGACVGSTLATILTIPVFGILKTCVSFGVLSLLVGIITMAAVPRRKGSGGY